jgi:CDP-diacylglycerol--serine O-phosphatidyltransferase
LITLAAVFAALLAIVWARSEPYWACNAIIAAALCDMLDGRVARLLDAQSEFGGELDSLADVVAFGVAPAILMLQQVAPAQPSIAWLLAPFAFVACSAIRLARFNLGGHAGDDFRGIPTPVAALLVTTLVMARYETGWSIFAAPWLGVAALLLAALLMVAPLPFPSYKRFRSRATQVAYFAAMAGGLTLLIVGGPGGSVLLALLVVYVLRGLIGGLVGRTA